MIDCENGEETMLHDRPSEKKKSTPSTLENSELEEKDLRNEKEFSAE